MVKPTFEFDIRAWVNDTKLQACSLEARALWLYLIFYLVTGKPRGHLSVDEVIVATKAGITPARYKKLLDELENQGVFSRTAAGVIYSRRIVRLAAQQDVDTQALKDAFETLVDHYPNATLVSVARGEWQRLCADGTLTAANVHTVLAGLDRWKASRQWREDDGKFIPSLHKWLAEKRWQDRPQQDLLAVMKRSNKGTDPMAIFDPSAKD